MSGIWYRIYLEGGVDVLFGSFAVFVPFLDPDNKIKTLWYSTCTSIPKWSSGQLLLTKGSTVPTEQDRPIIQWRRTVIPRMHVVTERPRTMSSCFETIRTAPSSKSFRRRITITTMTTSELLKPFVFMFNRGLAVEL